MVHRCLALLVVVLLIAAGCGSGSNDTAPNTETSEAATGENSGADEEPELGDRASITIASAWLPASLDPTSEGYTLIQRGAGETLTRVGHDQSIKNWLAESIEPVDDTTWSVGLRQDVVFWNGEPMTSQHVVDAIERNWEQQPATAEYLPESTRLEIVDDHTLTLTLPEPDSGLRHNLATPNLVIHTMDGEAPVMTGPYQPVSLRADEELVLQSFDEYWGDTPPLAEIRVVRVADGNARELAVQSGDVDFVTEASPEGAAMVGNGVDSYSVDSTRVHFMGVNNQQPPFNDPAVRRATNLAIDRDELNNVALGGLGAPTSTIVPPGVGIEVPDQLEHDFAAAEAVLDDAGWERSADGVREKDGQALEFLIYTYPGRPELTPMTVSIQDQLGRIGVDVSVQEVDDVVAEIDGTDYQAAMFSINMLPTGDPFYALQLLAASDGRNNFGNYQRDEFDALLSDIRLAEAPDVRSDRILEAQQMLVDDDAIVFLISAPRAVIYRPDRLEQPDLHPSEMYFIQTDLPVPAS